MANIYSSLMLLFLIFVNCSESSLNPYKTLSVSKSSSQREIKRAYKQLAREWHPDKNQSPGAQEKFIQIQQAYEILSDEGKKREYDQFGYVDPHENRQNQDPFGGHGHPFQHFDFGSHGSFNFKFQGSRSSDGRRVTLHRYQNGILPQSHEKPFLLLVTGNFCFQCMNLEGVWADVAPELESLGVGMGTVNIDMDNRISSLLGVRYRPAIVAIIKEEVRNYGQGTVTLRKLKEFVDGLLPHGLIQEVNNNNYKEFLASFYNENKPRVLLYSQSPEQVSFMFRLAAFAFQEHQTFGVAMAKDANTDQLGKHIGLWPREGAILVFKENVNDSVDRLEEKAVTRDGLHHLLSSNKNLILPRLSSQALFEELCPESPLVLGRKLCVVQITMATPEHEHFRLSFRQLVMETPSWPHQATLTYMLYDRQQEVAMAMEDLELTDEHSVPIAVIWRQNGNQVRLAWVPDRWEGDNLPGERRALKTFLYALYDGTAKFTHKLVLPQFNDENAPAWYIQIMNGLMITAKSWWTEIVNFLYRSTGDSSSLLVIVMGIYMLCFMLAFLGLLPLGKGPEGDGPNVQQRQPNGQAEQSDQATRQRPAPRGGCMLKELKVGEYQTMVASRRNMWHLVLLTRERTKEELFYRLSREIGGYRLPFPFSSVSLDRQWAWYRALNLESEDGTVIALRMSKKHFCVFSPSRSSQRPHSAVRRRHLHGNGDAIDGQFVGLEDSEDERDEWRNTFQGLTLWLDRLQDGELYKHVVEEWPDMV
ncbi:dnaJ homolog subfamily C member 16-like [Diadema antillarum]|uniref:dnaJ homolog subfamily C member 16-like n=1 Tax=Diadema antillarum TaxID=105358 RepID=UPI003A85F8E4